MIPLGMPRPLTTSMIVSRGALAVAILALAALATRPSGPGPESRAAALVAQPTLAQNQATDLGFGLQANYPNPFVASTTIPFTLEAPLFAEASPATVTMRVFNVLSQSVAHPVAVDHPSGAVDLRSISYETPGDYEARWDGTDDNASVLPPGVYILELVVNGRQLLRRIHLAEPAAN